jgi:hypothetical protein
VTGDASSQEWRAEISLLVFRITLPPVRLAFCLSPSGPGRPMRRSGARGRDAKLATVPGPFVKFIESGLRLCR